MVFPVHLPYLQLFIYRLPGNEGDLVSGRGNTDERALQLSIVLLVSGNFHVTILLQQLPETTNTLSNGVRTVVSLATHGYLYFFE